MRAAVYIRVSTEEQAVHGYSLSEQKEACCKRAEELGASEVLIFADEGVSGAVLDRPGLNALRDAVDRGQVDCIILRDPDRLSRKLAHQLFLSEEFEKTGARLEFLDFEWKTTPEGRLFYSIKGAIAEYEREKIRERVTRGKLQKARQGGIPVNFDVYGYRYDPATGEVSLDDDEADVVRKIFRWFTQEEIGIAGVANRLNELKVPTRRGKDFWHRQVVKQILINPVFIGEWRYGKKRPPDEVITIPVPAIVDRETWQKAQDKLHQLRRKWPKKSSSYLLSGLLICADCGNTMGGAYLSWWGKRKRCYTCRRSRAVSQKQGCCPSKTVAADLLEKTVWEQVKVLFCDPLAVAREAAAACSSIDELKKEYELLTKRLNKIEKGRISVTSALAAGLLELDEKTRKRLMTIKSREERLKKRKLELEQRLESKGKTIAENELSRLAQQLLDGIDQLSFNEKSFLLRSLISQIMVEGRPEPGSSGKNLSGMLLTIVLKADPGYAGLISR
ncbi:MAG TPA: recombinase family protein [Syntrophaceticus sp.]|nr:recombinase family protein [Syntrophaceticus sp.]